LLRSPCHGWIRKLEAKVAERLKVERRLAALTALQPPPDEEQAAAHRGDRELQADLVVGEPQEQRAADENEAEELERPAETGEHGNESV